MEKLWSNLMRATQPQATGEPHEPPTWQSALVLGVAVVAAIAVHVLTQEKDKTPMNRP